jgi:hypothetical protein
LRHPDGQPADRGGTAVDTAVQERLGQPLRLSGHVAVGEIEGHPDGVGDEVESPVGIGVGDVAGCGDQGRTGLAEASTTSGDRAPQLPCPAAGRCRHIVG